jgi:16S rRNA (uracil1498-N3)-methyltransferase
VLPALNAPLIYPELLTPGQQITLGPAHARGLRFREINPKEAFTIVDSEGRAFRASLGTLTSNGGSAVVYEAMEGSPESPAWITLLCAVLARQRMLTVVQKATELGVMRIVPVISERSVQREGLAHEKAHAWPRQALRAARQCRRASVPEVLSATTLGMALDDPAFAGADRRFYLDDRAPQEQPPRGERGALTLVLVVGPEGGLSDDERSTLATRNASPLRFGARVLRAETAVVVGMAHLQATYGDL